MYVTPIRLDLLLNTNQFPVVKVTGMWEDLLPIQSRTAIIYSSVKEEKVFIYCVYLDIFCRLG